MNTILGILRIVALVFAALTAFVLIFITSLVPFSVRRVRASLWIVVYACRVYTYIFNVRINSTDLKLLRNHEGLILMNHMSYLEALGILSLAPVRFLAAVEVRVRPVSGWMAEQIGTIFVRREDRTSRSEARDSMVKVFSKSLFPPLVVFPEGRLGDGVQLHQFRYGIFEIACQERVPYLLCAVQFNRPDVSVWRGPRGESLTTAMWRLAKSCGKIYVDLFPLYVVHPTPKHNPRELAKAARRDVAAKLEMSSHIPA